MTAAFISRNGTGNPQQDVLGRLRGVKQHQSGWQAICPAHEDRRASLSVGVGDDGKVLLRCHAGCKVEDIVIALGLGMADLFPHDAPVRVPQRRIVRVYNYTDESGTLLYQAVRYQPKDFRQRQPDGKGGWLWNLRGARRVLYRLPEIIAASQDQAVFIVEGEKDADRLAKENILATTCAMGAGKWRPEYNDALAGRHIVILPDNDEPGRAHAEQVALALNGVAASVKVVALPGLPPKGDVSDWLDSGGTAAELWELVEKAPAGGGRGHEPPPRPAGQQDEGEVVEAEDDPHRLARLFLADYTTDQGRRLHFWRGEWLAWDGGAYRTFPGEELKAQLCHRIKEEFDRLNRVAVQQWEESGRKNAKGQPTPKPSARKVTVRLTTDVSHALASLVVLPSSLTTPSWLGEKEFPPPFPAAGVLACRNALVSLPDLAEGRACRVAPTPRFFSVNALDYDFDPQAARPSQWLDFLRKLWPKDESTIVALQEWFGYCLLPDTSQQKILMIVGPKRSGKGTIARVLRGLVGMDNTGAPTLAGLGTNFGLWPLLDKMIAVVSDARLSGRTDTAVVTERLLAISGEDAQTVDRKNMRPVTAKLPVRFLILTNELPKLNDPSGALAGRLIVLRQTKSWYGQEDTRLTDKLLTELPGILLWSIEGWKRLQARGRFVQPDSALKLVRDMEDLSSPIGAFLREHCVLGPGLEVPCRGLFERWKKWCEEAGHQHHGSEQTFGRDLRSAVPGLDDRRPRQDGGSRQRWYVGVGLRAEQGDGELPE
jgi:putative DNA primase/helicase